MQADRPIATKQDAIEVLRKLIQDGRDLAESTPRDRSDLAAAEAARAYWQLRCKRLLRELVGDSSALMRLSAPIPAMTARPTFTEETQAFEERIRQPLAALERVAIVLGQLA